MQSALRILQSVAVTLASVASGSAQWQQITSGTTDSLTAITWVDGRYLVAGGGFTFLRSLDDGASFSATQGYAPGFDGAPLDHLSFHDSLVGFGTSTLNCCAFQSTADGGVTWLPTFPSNDRIVMRIALDATNQVVFKSGAGVQFNTNGLLLFETDAMIYADIDSVCPVPDSGNCWVSQNGNDTIYSTGSYGWTLTSNDRGGTIQSGTFPYSSYLYAAQQINDTTIAYLDYGAVLRVSHDRGVTWQRRSTLPIALATISPAFAMYDAENGAFVDVNGQINLTTDSGFTWTPVSTPTNVPLNDLLYLDAQYLLAVGDAGTILSSSDGGSTWAIEESGTTERLHALATSGAATSAIGTNGTILRRFPAHSGLGLSTTVVEHFDDGPKLSPNPASTTLDVRFLHPAAAGEPRFTIVDALGRPHLVAARRADTGVWQMDITQLTQGIHTLHVSMDKAVWKRNFLVIR